MNEAAMEPHDRYLEVAGELAHLGVTTAKLFGHPALVSGRKSLACLSSTGLACRLGAATPEHARALALPGAELFDPSGAGRAMNDWVVVPFTDEAEWTEFAQAAQRHLG